MTTDIQPDALHQQLGRGVTRRIMRGVLLLLPLMVTFWLIQFAVQTMDGLLQPIISAISGDEIPGLSFAIIIVALFLVGALSSNFLFRTPGMLLERGIKAVPGVGSIYNTTKKLLPGSDRSAKAPTGFDTVVRIEYPRTGVVRGLPHGHHRRRRRGQVRRRLHALDAHAPVGLARPAPSRRDPGDRLELGPGHAVHRLRRGLLPGVDDVDRDRGPILKTVAHVLLFNVAGIVFVLGLGMQANPALGTLLWIVVAAFAVSTASGCRVVASGGQACGVAAKGTQGP